MQIELSPFERGTVVYPHPIAQSCGSICRARHEQEQIDAVLKCAEVVTRYVAALAISSFAARSDAGVAPPEALEKFDGNLSFGHFLSVVQAIAKLKCDHPLRTKLTQAFKAKGGDGRAGESLATLLTLRNSLSHNLASSSKAQAVTTHQQHTPAQHLQHALEALDSLLRLPLFVLEEQRYTNKTHTAQRLLLMGETSDPVPETVQLAQFLDHDRKLYVGLPDGILCVYPFLLWEVVFNKQHYGLYLLDARKAPKSKFATVDGDKDDHNGDIVTALQKRVAGQSIEVEQVTLNTGASFFNEWLEKRKLVEQVHRETSGKIPWGDFEPETVHWYGQRLGATGDTQATRTAITKQLLDGRERLKPEEVTQLLLLFGREEIILRRLGRQMIDCRLRKDDDQRWDAREESAANILQCLKHAIAFFSKHIGKDGTTIDGLQATSGSADYIAVRESLVNLFIHQDYADPSTVAQIQPTPDQALFFNAGKALVRPDSLIQGGRSQSRNPLISRALRLIGFAELAGSGLPAVYRAWRDEQRRPPIVESNDESNSFTLVLDWRPAPRVTDVFWKRRIGATVTPVQATALMLAADPLGTSVDELAVAHGVSVDEAQSAVQSLITNVLVRRENGRITIQDHLRAAAEEAKVAAASHEGTNLTT